MTTSRDKMVKKNRTLAELGEIRTAYPIKLRVKAFTVEHQDGSNHHRGPCLSLQQFNPQGHFLSAISIDAGEMDLLIAGLRKAQREWPEEEGESWQSQRQAQRP